MSSIDDGAPLKKSDPDRAHRNTSKVTAGFGSPGEDATAKRIDLNDALISHPEATFVFRARGSAMHGLGIDDGDVLVVDRAIKPSHGHVVVAVVENEHICRQLHMRGKDIKLTAPAPDVQDVVFKDGAELVVWGVVTFAVKPMPH